MKRTYSLFAPFVLLTLAACSAESGSNENSSSSSKTALLGAPVDASHHYSVGVCGSGALDGDGGTTGACVDHRCTGTLVAPNLVLTSRHCVTDPVYGDDDLFCQGAFSGPISTAKVTLSDSSIEGNPAWLDVSEQFFPGGTNDCDDDIALLVLAKNVADSDASPIAIDVDTDIAATPASAYTIVGRGSTSDAFNVNNGNETFDAGGFVRRVLSNIPVACTGGLLADGGTCSVVDYSSPDNTFSPPASLVAIGFGVASGDSGSGFLEQASFDANAPKVQAVTTGFTVDANGVPNHGLGTRTSIHKAFLVATATHAASAGGYALPTWAGGTIGSDGGLDASVPDGGHVIGDAGSDTDSGANGGDPGFDGGSSCSAAPGQPESAAFGLGIFAALGLVVARRRRS